MGVLYFYLKLRTPIEKEGEQIIWFMKSKVAT